MSRLAKLTERQLEEIRRFEERWKNVVLMVYEKPAEPAAISPEQLKKIQKLEKELDVILVAYRQ
jgi:hypothetical protein